MVNPLWALVDAAVAVVAIRSILLVRGRSPFTALGWFLAFWYGVVQAVRFSSPENDLQRLAGPVAYWLMIGLALAFIVGSFRDERQAEPWWWPVRLGRTRAERRPPRV
jgi:hypothetical protein